MLVLGYSGLDGSAAYKRSILPPGDPRLLRMRQGLDSAAVLVRGTEVLAAAAQERFDGDKGTGAFPADAMEACLRASGAGWRDLDAVAHSFAYLPSPLWQLDTFTTGWWEQVYRPERQSELLAGLRRGDAAGPPRLVTVPHHRAHAASAYYLSGFDDALVLVADALGEHDAITLYEGRGAELTQERAHPVGSSLGLLYGLVTHYLGFLMNMDEYKVMGLAPYGDPARFRETFRQLVRLGDDGAVSVPVLGADRTPLERETHRGVVLALEEALGPAREPEDGLNQRHMDVAAALQQRLEEALLHILRAARRRTGLRRLCMAGGVALNCSANGVLLREGLFDDIFVQPAAGDDGSALGAALSVARDARPHPPVRMTMPFWGQEFTDAEIRAALDRLPEGCTVVRRSRAELIRDTVDLVRAGNVVALFQGPMEFGPRALGNRSILADPTRATMRAHLNTVVKQREEFRPFAPIVTAETADTYFDTAGKPHVFHHMLFVTDVRPPYREKLPAVTHVDGSARVQVVERETAPLLWDLLAETGRRTGVPVLVNTSFNLRGQPIVRTPLEAVETLARSTIDALVIGDHVVTRDQPTAAVALDETGERHG
ncbi:hypothetical protein H7827_01345 [Streptomyces sp. JH002]|uniref:carbamoyltransferase family protein n=1 Tax=Streptomyces sp. JH002 TaxID=2763259 RepID=UPI003D80418A